MLYVCVDDDTMAGSARVRLGHVRSDLRRSSVCRGFGDSKVRGLEEVVVKLRC